MMNWLYYLLEANLYLALFYGFYRLFLQNETFYNLNRYFLLFSAAFSFVLPILQIGLLKLPIKQNLSSVSSVSTGIETTEINWVYIFYLFIAFCFAVKLSLNIYKIIKISINGKKYPAGDITLVEVNGESTAFSFFNLLFIHPQLADKAAVIKHEMVHINQKHSFDVVFFELIQIICWFNPILYFLKKDMKLLHEYIADELTTSADVQKHEYALFLIQNSFGLRAQPITNQIFNQSILKRRINMLNKKRTAGWARLRLLLALPLTGAMLCTSTMAFTKDYGYVDLLPEKSNLVAPIQENPKVEDIKKSTAPQVKDVKRKDQVKFPPPIVRQDKPLKGKKTLQPPKVDVVRFPPPVVKPDKAATPETLAPPAPEKDQVKFPPPIVRPDAPRKSTKTPPPVEPPPPHKRDQIKFPPPIVRPDAPRKSTKIPPPVEPPPPPKRDQIKFPPPVVKPDVKKESVKEKVEDVKPVGDVQLVNLKLVESVPAKDVKKLKIVKSAKTDVGVEKPVKLQLKEVEIKTKNN